MLRQQLILVSFFAALTLTSLALPMSELHIPMRHFLPMHTVMEFVAITVAFLVFATVWHTPTKLTSGSLLVLGLSLFSAGWLDIFHALSYKGMPDFVTPASVEKAICFWLAARFMVASGLLLVSFQHTLSPVSMPVRYGTLGIFALINLLVTWLIVFHEAELPHTFIEGIGVTPLKTRLEWLIIGMMTLAAWRYYRLARVFDEDFLPLIFSATVVGALGETFFTQYHVVSDLQHFLGHSFKMISYGLMYQAMFIVSVRRPYQQLASRKQSLLQANESLRVHSLALDSTATPVLVANLQGHVRWRNRAAMKMSPILFAEQANELRLFAAPLTPDATQALEIQTSVSSGHIWRGLVHLVSVDCKSFIFDRTVTPLRDEKNAIEGYVIVGDNVTERLETQLRHKRVLDSALDGFWVADIEGNLLEVNEAYARMSGYTVEELVTMRIDQLEAVEQPHEVLSHFQKIRQLGSSQFETRHRRKSGDMFSVDISATYDYVNNQVFTFIRDRTERAQAAAIKLDLERQLQQSQKMEALGQLTGGIAHDFNNILAAVLGYSNLALERFAPDKQGKLATYLREIIGASERARDLIAKMLTFARKQPSVSVHEISPAAVVHDVSSMLRHSIPAGIELRETIKDRLNIRMDAGELNQMLVNLIINARDAIGEQGLIEVELHQVMIEGDICSTSKTRLFGSYLALDVSDNGSGIAPEHLPRLFDPFFTTKEVGKGTGLGLSMVQGILRRSHGHIVVTSEPGQGSRFRLLFPIAQPAEPPAKADSDQQTIQPGLGQHIWVVDDEPTVVHYMGELLETAGYQIRLFTDPYQVVKAFKTSHAKVDLLITDQTMPGLNGVALTQQLLAWQPELPVILCSGYSDSISREEVLAAGIRRFYTKPVSAQILLNAVAEELVQTAHHARLRSEPGLKR
ncbi:hybrid sensor histidine kinase/response regulator [Rhodoferax lithotrophicus]|uniref:hybrid sensor histidine kinase/response regulator n=1 Tax=Rhodoferax lithotrophicus TaxID=2798804 RepID=UPI001CC43446|nr:MASE3 domain-containing protein [Rhodoferax sp. MIZ03]